MENNRVYVKKKLYDEESEVCLRILAMDFYGLILFFFLSIEMMIDFKTINMIKSEHSQIQSSSNNVSRHPNHLRYCIQLLFIWIMTHMINGRVSGLFSTPWHLYLMVEKFDEQLLKESRKTT